MVIDYFKLGQRASKSLMKFHLRRRQASKCFTESNGFFYSKWKLGKIVSSSPQFTLLSCHVASKTFWTQSGTQKHLRMIKITSHLEQKRSKCKLLTCISTGLLCCLFPVLSLAFSPGWALEPCCSLVSSSGSGPGSISSWWQSWCELWIWFTSCLGWECWWTHPALPTTSIPLSTVLHHCPGRGHPHLPVCPPLGTSCLLLPLDKELFRHFDVASSLLSASLGTYYLLPLSLPPLPFYSLQWLPWQLHAWRCFWTAGICFSRYWQEYLI